MARGGKRPGAGRPKGRKDKSTVEQLATLEELAREHTPLALDTLARICTASESDAARVSAAQALLDRGYGKPKQSIDGVVDLRNFVINAKPMTEDEFEASFGVEAPSRPTNGSGKLSVP